MSGPASRFRRRSLAGERGYVPGEQIDGDRSLRLHTNEAALPPSPAITQAIARAATSVRRYPHPLGEPLRSALASHHGVEPEQVLVANGADGVLDTCFRAFCEPGDRVLLTAPTYPLLPVLGRTHAADIEILALTSEGGLPEGFSQGEAVMRFLANPNSPTGTWLSPEIVERELGNASGLVIIDEAYGDFAPSSCLPLIDGHDHLVVVRSFSKGYALAGMRVGYAVAQAAVIGDLQTVRDVYPNDRCSLAAATAALADQRHHRALVDLVRKERVRVTGWLVAAGWDVLPSEANFVLARPPSGLEASAVASGLRDAGILVRHFTGPTSDRLRITIGTGPENDRLIAALAGPDLVHPS